MTISAEAIQSPEFEQALEKSIAALQRLADFRLDAAITSRMQALGEKKEFLSDDERRELMSFVSFAESRNLEKLEAKVALKKLETFVTELSS